MILLDFQGKIKGDCEMKGYEEHISLTSASWELEREFGESAKMGTKDINLGQPNMPPIELAKSMDVSSADFFQHSVAGTIVCDIAYINFISTQGVDVDSSKQVAPFLCIKLQKPFVSKYSLSGEEDERPTESITLWYYAAHMTYTAIDDKGKPKGKKHQRGWSRTSNSTWQ